MFWYFGVITMHYFLSNIIAPLKNQLIAEMVMQTNQPPIRTPAIQMIPNIPVPIIMSALILTIFAIVSFNK